MVQRQQQADRALRPAMRSPGRPMPARHVERAFWRLIVQGISRPDRTRGLGSQRQAGAQAANRDSSDWPGKCFNSTNTQ